MTCTRSLWPPTNGTSLRTSTTPPWLRQCAPRPTIDSYSKSCVCNFALHANAVGFIRDRPTPPFWRSINLVMIIIWLLHNLFEASFDLFRYLLVMHISIQASSLRIALYILWLTRYHRALCRLIENQGLDQSLEAGMKSVSCNVSGREVSRGKQKCASSAYLGILIIIRPVNSNPDCLISADQS